MHYLTQDQYLDFLQVPKKQGEDFTHLANLKTPNGSQRCYIKIYPDSEQSLLNEIIGYLYAKALGIPVPEHAGLVELTVGEHNADLLHHYIPDKHSWIKNEEEVIAWWTSDESAPSINTVFGFDDLNQLREQSSEFYSQKINKLLHDAAIQACKKKHLGNICAFDHIFANIDRNLGNLLLGTNLIAIDHGKIFGSNFWKPEQLPAIADMDHPHRIRHLLNNVLQEIPEPVKMRAITQFDSIKQFCDDTSTKDVLEFIQEFQDLEPDKLNNFLSVYLAKRLAQESDYKNSFGVLI